MLIVSGGGRLVLRVAWVGRRRRGVGRLGWRFGVVVATMGMLLASPSVAGATWRATTLRVVGRGDGLDGVAASHGGRVWAVGARDNAWGVRTLVFRRGRLGWRRSVSADRGGARRVNDQLDAVVAVSGRSVWAVGSSIRRSGANPRTLIEHWTPQTGWRIVPSPSPTPGEPSLSGVCRVPGRHRLWAVGGVLDPSTQTSGSLIEHWNGQVWARVPTPNLGSSTDAALYGCVALSPSDAWAVGASTQLLHWNGSSWQLVPLAGGNLGDFEAITRTPRSPQMWTAGVSGGGVPISARWMPSTSWQPVATDTTQIGEGAGLSGVAALSTIDVWAVGDWVPTQGGVLDPFIEHWDGLAWTYVPFNQDNTSGLSAVARIPGTNTLWAVGSDNGRPLVARGP